MVALLNDEGVVDIQSTYLQFDLIIHAPFARQQMLTPSYEGSYITVTTWKTINNG
jgi:hypothetical protein